jgi:4-methyl-5(b-hydroxyethyl)-thiazole monophosphate biosynthesis
MKRVLLLLANGFEALEAAAITDVLGWANEFGSEPIEVVAGGLHDELQCTWTLKVAPTMHVRDVEVERFDALALPGGFEKAGFYEDAFAEEFLDVIRRFSAAGKPIAAICTGTLPVGMSGVLQGRQATTYHLMEGRRRKELAAMGASVADAPIVGDGNIITCAGPAAALDTAFALLRDLTSDENAKAVRHWMGFPD